MSFATSAFSVSDVTAETKMEAFFKIGTKSGKNKTQGLKWKSHENIGTKSDFIPIGYYCQGKKVILVLVSNLNQ